MDRMSVQDASFLYSETERDLHHNAWLGVFEGPAPSREEFRALIASKLARIPRYRQRVRFVPGDVATPVWVDDVYFNLDWHLRSIALPAPGDDSQMRELFCQLMAVPLDRAKPLWEMWTIDGLSGSRWGLISKLHHCMADGASTTDITTILLDADPDAPVGEPDAWVATPSPSDQELLEQALLEARDQGVRMTDRYSSLMTSLRQRTEEVDRAFASLGESLSQPLSIPDLNGPIGPYRRWEWASVQLADIATVRKRFGGTVNDVVLALVTRAFRDLLLSRGEDLEGRTVRTMVPVSVRAAEDSEGNRVSSMYAELPVGVADPVERLTLIRTQLDGLKEAKQALAGDVIASFAGFQPPQLAALAARTATQGDSPVNTTTTNVPGPQYPLYALGRRMVADWPYITLAGTVRVATTVFSYDGVLRFGVTGDLESMPDLALLPAGIDAGLRELLETEPAEVSDTPEPAEASETPEPAEASDTPEPAGS